MPRPSRVELMRRFFPELGKTGSRGETKAAIELNTRACEAVLADQIELFDRFHREHGPGALCLRLAGGDRASHYATLADFCQDLSAADAAGDTAMASALKGVVEAIKATDTSAKVLILLIDNSAFSLLPVPREYPARAIQALQEEFTV